jgi:tetratricopeptide (TPR) repeat protein
VVLLNLSPVLAVDSENPQAMRWFNLGLKEKDPQKKIAAYAKAIELDPKFIEAYYNIGLAYRQAQDLARAETFLQRALEVDPAKLKSETKLQVTYELAATYKRQGKNKEYERAVLEAKGLAKTGSIRNKINLELGRYYYERERYDEAVRTLRDSGQLSATEANEFNALIRQAESEAELRKNYEAGIQAKNGGNFSGALVLFEQVRGKKPGYKDVDAQIAQVNAAMTSGSQKQALTNLLEQARSYEAAGNLEMALASYEGVLKLDAGHLEARAKYENVKQQLAKKQLAETLEREYNAGMTAFKNRDWTRATLAFEKVLDNDPNFKDARSRLAEAQKALDRENKETVAARYYAEGVSAMNRGDLGGALAALERVSKINPQYRNTSGLLKQIEQTLAQQPVAEKISPKSDATLDSLYQQSVVLAEAQDWMQAVITLEKLALLAPDYRDVSARLEHARTQLQHTVATEKTAVQKTADPASASIWQNTGAWAALLLVPLIGLVMMSPTTRARYHLLRNDYAAAAAIYERLLARHPERTKLYPALANLYFLLGRRDARALKIYKTILQLNLPIQNREGINAIVAEHFLTEGRTDSDAIEVLENALKTEQGRFHR